jgi:methylated-DNA-[protein]-cysteine S-methyltransferase
MSTSHYAVFPTAIGECALIWGTRGVRGLALPEEAVSKVRARVREQFGAPEEVTPDGPWLLLIDALRRLLSRQRAELSEVALDMAGIPPFHQRVYTAARDVGIGETVTYGELARRVGSPKAARAVGQALGANPFAIIVPCHRIVSASHLGGFTAHGGTATKQRLLEIERAIVGDAGQGAAQLGWDWASSAAS